jgi:thiol-disulfide isomerase/thioredoxin
MSNIINLTSSDFYSKKGQLYVKNVSRTPGMLLIWAKWCGHCHRFIPVYEQIAKRLGKEFQCTAIEHSDFKDYNNLVDALDFKYFPTIKFFDQSGRIIGTYEGDRNESSVLQHICKVYHHCIMQKSTFA